MRDERILRFALAYPWAIEERKMGEILEVLERHAAGIRLDAEELRARFGSADPVSTVRAGSVAVLPVYGTIAQRLDLVTQASGGTSTIGLTQRLRAALRDPEVGAIVFDVDSPGGSVYGVQELASEILDSRGIKPIIAVANSLMASAAYWIGAAADEVVVTPSGEIGSIGVLAIHRDFSEREKMLGIKTTIFRAGRFKGEGNDSEPLSDEASENIQTDVERYYRDFVNAVAKSRGVPPKVVREGFGEGRVVGARQAVESGMADRVATLDEVIAGALKRRKTKSPAAQAQQEPAPEPPPEPMPEPINEPESDPDPDDLDFRARRLRRARVDRSVREHAERG